VGISREKKSDQILVKHYEIKLIGKNNVFLLEVFIKQKNGRKSKVSKGIRKNFGSEE